MSGADDGLVINGQAVTEIAERIPVRHGDSARRTARSMPVGQLFGNSPAGRSLAEAWRLAVDHHGVVTEGLEQDLVELRQALITVVDNTAASEAQTAARYAQAAQEYTATAEQSATDLEGLTEEFVAANESEVADELAQEHGSPSGLTVPDEGGADVASDAGTAPDAGAAPDLGAGSDDGSGAGDETGHGAAAGAQFK